MATNPTHQWRAAWLGVLVASSMNHASFVFAEDLIVPAWRGGFASRYQVWRFPAGNPSGPAPDLGFVHASLIVQGTNPPQTEWQATFGSRDGVWRLDAQDAARLEFRIPQFSGPRNEVRVQVTYRSDAPDVRVMGDSGDDYGLDTSATSDLSDSWKHSYTRWSVGSCDTVVVRVAPPASGVSFVDEVIIDTVCFSEENPAYAQDGAIGVFFDPQGATCSGNVPVAIPTTLFILACLRGQTAGGITGAEFAVYERPAEWLTISIENPLSSLTLGDPFGDGANIAFPACQTGNNGIVLLYTVTVLALEDVQDVRLQVVTKWSPHSPHVVSPILNACNPPVFSEIRVSGGTAIVNGAPCTVAVEERSWGEVKALFR